MQLFTTNSTEPNPWLHVALLVPGITGSTGSGLSRRDDTLEKMEGRIKYDLEYIRSWSLWLDIKLIVMTAAVDFLTKMPIDLIETQKISIGLQLTDMITQISIMIKTNGIIKILL